MPEHTDPAIPVDGLFRSDDGFPHREILVVCGDDLHHFLGGIVETHEVLDDVEQTFLRKHAVNHGAPRRGLRSGIIAIHRLPSRVTVLIRRNRANPGLGHIAHHAKHVGHEQARYLLHVLAQLQVSVRSVRLLARRGLQLEQHQRHAIHENDDVGTFLGIFHERPLVHDVEIVVLRIVEIKQPNDVIALFLAVKEVHFNS